MSIKNIVEAKSFTRLFNLSGINLLLALGVILSSGVLISDLVGDRLPWQLNSLTLPFAVCAIATALLGVWIIPMLVRLKTGQIIREDGPQAHLKKAGTPTMGGVFFVPVAIIGAILLSGAKAEVLAVCALTMGYALIGWLDDWQILRYKSNKGISPKMKLALQIGFAVLFCLWLAWTQTSSITNVALPFNVVLPIGLLFWLLAVFVLVAESNATNLTDGVDGLAAGTSAIALLGLGVLIAPSYPGLMTFCACMSGSCLGFLVHNRNPARVFMGDTGSLALGGALASVALLTNTLWALFVLSGIFFIETLSVMAQVGYYKATKGDDGVGKRLFKMAPLHHHLELSGWSETQVVATFYGISSILALLCLVTVIR
ncbi:phospho-N-acetylmuramoyl-pentapeptide-transferase [Synechocystis sp. PCC 7509]|uniref:phospho-N-acetylmuramoyl-pentapeptide- transferase n=1 Tax=Synechocystis sp. PCC 7509 TaxID=927677 RepID=UPI0002AC47D6|nr:phospho-N-acetylmuramoyl-pentapeptide-transferase [Synechocystis sp. PCC 7509]